MIVINVIVNHVDASEDNLLMNLHKNCVCVFFL